MNLQLCDNHYLYSNNLITLLLGNKLTIQNRVRVQSSNAVRAPSIPPKSLPDSIIELADL